MIREKEKRMRYDDWKATEPPQEEPNRCTDCGHPEGYCACVPCCAEPPAPDHQWEPNFYGACRHCGRPCSVHGPHP